MNTRAYKLLGAIIVLGGVACTSRLHAQSTFSLPFSLTQSSPATGFSIDANGTLIEKGPLNSNITLTLSGTSQMVWLPALGAFRAGLFTNTQATIGQYSVALGWMATASGVGSGAIGQAVQATGVSSFATGFASAASGGTSTALGSDVVASGTASFAVGGGSTASGAESTATGSYTVASGNCSTATGNSTTANSFSAFVTGLFNTGLSSTGATPNATSWVATDPLLEVGNGTNYNAKSDALILYKNGNMTVQGVVTVAAGGDIPMYTGN